MSSHMTIWNDPSRSGENNDCGVVALTAATGLDYADIHAELKRMGRKDRKSTPMCIIETLLSGLGLSMVAVTHSFRARTIRTLEREIPRKGVYMVLTGGQSGTHIMTFRDGVPMDWTKGRCNRILHVWRIDGF